MRWRMGKMFKPLTAWWLQWCWRYFYSQTCIRLLLYEICSTLDVLFAPLHSSSFVAFNLITSFASTSSSLPSVPSSSYASWPWPFIHSIGHKAYRQLYRRSLLSNLQKPNWIADGLSFVCHFISSPKSTPNNAWRGRGALISSIYQRPEWVKSGWKVKGEGVELTGYDFSSISCIGSVYMRWGQTVKTAASSVFSSAVLHFTPICHRLFHLLSVGMSCIVRTSYVSVTLEIVHRCRSIL